MKLSKKVAHLALKKVVSIIIIAGIAISLTACPADTAESGSQIDDRIEASTRTTETNPTASFSEPQQSIADTTATTPSETTTEATEPTTLQGAYSYILYTGTPQQTTINMDYDIQPGSPYLQQHSNPTAYYYEIDTLASSLGWKLNGAYSIEQTNEDTGPTYFYTYDYGEYLVMLEIEASQNITYYDCWSQIESIYIHFVEKDDFEANYFDDSDSNHRSIVIEFADHSDAIEYPGLGSEWAFSYNDYVLLTYFFWAFPQLGEAKMDVVYNTISSTAIEITTEQNNTTVLRLQ